jgi:tetratricopeptide (TPR) repeat protein
MSFSTHSSTPNFPDGDSFMLHERDGNQAHNFTVEDCEHSSQMLETKASVRVKSPDRHLAIEHNGFAHTSYQLRDYTAALEAIDRAIVYDPDRTDFYYQRALIAKALNNYPQVIADCQQILSRSPQHQAAQRLAAIALVKTKKYRVALAHFDRYIELYSQDAHGYCYRGICYDRLQQYTPAIADFDMAIDLKPEEAIFHHARGRTHQQLGNFSAALADYNRAIEIKPLRARVYDDRAEIYRLQGDYLRTIADCTQAIDLNPLLIDAYFRRGIAYTELGDLDLALVDYDLIIALDPNHLKTYIQRSWIYFRRGKYRQAIQDCESAKQIDENCFWAYYLGGVINDISGFKEQAIADFTMAIELRSSSACALYHRGVIYYELGNHPDAIADFTQARSTQDCGLEQLITGLESSLGNRDETGFYAEGLALDYMGQVESAITTLKLALLVANRFGNTSIQAQIALRLQRLLDQ